MEAQYVPTSIAHLDLKISADVKTSEVFGNLGGQLLEPDLKGTMTDEVDVILLRSADAPDRYLQAFEAADLRAICEPVLSFAFPSQDSLRETLGARGRYGVLIATSPRVGTALEQVFSADEALAEKWRNAPVYAVGPKTAAAVRQIGLRPIGEDAGRAADLAKRIIGDDPQEPLLFLCGNRRRDVLPDRLTEAGVSFDELVVYETHTRTELGLPSPGGRTWLVFFSPSGLEAVQASDSVDPHRYRIAAIGPSTGEAIAGDGFSLDAVAQHPSPEALVRAIQEAEIDAPNDS